MVNLLGGVLVKNAIGWHRKVEQPYSVVLWDVLVSKEPQELTATTQPTSMVFLP